MEPDNLEVEGEVSSGRPEVNHANTPDEKQLFAGVLHTRVPNPQQWMGSQKALLQMSKKVQGEAPSSDFVLQGSLCLTLPYQFLGCSR